MDIEIGQVFNNFTVLKQLDKKAANGQRYFECKCICGAKREGRKSNLGIVKGCGCERSAYKSYTRKKSTIKKIVKAMVSNKEVKTDKPKQTISISKQYIERPKSNRERIEDALERKALRQSDDFLLGLVAE